MTAQAVEMFSGVEHLVRIDRQIDASESSALRARWEFGRAMLAARDGAGRLPNGYLTECHLSRGADPLFDQEASA